jgi:exopolysaccharide production protein ExoZ
LTVESTRQDIASIQMLRGIAATMVVFVHLDVQLERHGFGVMGTGWMATGVDIFFVISGFIMWVTTRKRRAVTAAEFMKNRVIRIVPLYWLVTLFVLAMALFAPQLLHTTVFDPVHTTASFLFLPARHPVTKDFWPLLVPGWTLNMEMLFYLLFALSIAWSGGSAPRRLAWLSALLCSVLLVAFALKSRIDVMNFYANPIILEFLAGAFLGVLYLSGKMRVSRLWFGAIVVGFLLLWRGGAILPTGVPFVGTAASMIVAGALFAPPVRIKFLETVGDASYSLYLTHVIMLSAVAALWIHQPVLKGAFLFSTVSLGAAIALAHVCYRFVELPLGNRLRSISMRSAGATRTMTPPKMGPSTGTEAAE